MNTTLPKLIALSLLLGSTASHAYQGFYAGATVGNTWLNDTCAQGDSCSDEDDFSYSIIGGFQFNDNIGFEFGFQDMGEFDSQPGVGDVLVYSLAPKFGINVSDSLAIYGKVGGAFVDFDSGDDYSYLGAVGAEYSLSDSVDLRLEYQHLTDISSSVAKMNADSVNVGMVYRFGASQAQQTDIEVEPEVLVEAPAPVVEPEPEIITRVFNEKHVGTGYFETESSQLAFEKQNQLDELVSFLEQNQNAKVQIFGHTDSTGSELFNIKVSQERAESVAKYLEGSGIAEDRITVIAKGESEPVAENSTKEGRAKNRRVEIIIPSFEYQTTL